MTTANAQSGSSNAPRGRFVHMEKTVTETVRETQTTAPAPQASAAPAGQSESEKLLRTLVEALIGQKRADEAAEKAEAEAKQAETEQPGDGSVPVSAAVPADAAEDDEDESPEEAAKNDREDDEDFVDDADDSDRFSGNERIIGYNEETGCYIVAHYRKSFEGRLIQSRPNRQALLQRTQECASFLQGNEIARQLECGQLYEREESHCKNQHPQQQSGAVSGA